MFKTWVAALAGTVDRRDLIVVTGLVLIAVGTWEISRALALGLPGVVLVWYGLPTRPWFFDLPPARPRRRTE